jgi:two-component system, OmpR family, sensor histidine kinase VicK
MKSSEILYDIENTVKRGISFIQNAEKMDLFGDRNGPSIIMEFDVYKNNYIDMINRGGKIRLITEITKDNINYCKELMKIVTELRHLDGLIGGIAVSESEYMSTTALKRNELLTVAFYSNEEEVVRSGQYIFDTFWEKAIPAKRRIKEIEENLRREFIKTIQDPQEIRKLISKMISSASEEIQILFPSSNVLEIYRKEGLLSLLKEKAQAGKKSVVIKILIKKDYPVDELITSPFSQLENVKVLQSDSIDAKVVTMIVDKDTCFLIEMKDDLGSNIEEGAGLATYSNSQPTVSTCDSIFELIWLQAEMKQQNSSSSSGSSSNSSNSTV